MARDRRWPQVACRISCARTRSDLVQCSTRLKTIFLAIYELFLHQVLHTTINLSSRSHHDIQWRNRFDSHRRYTRHCSNSTTARHRAMFGPSQLCTYARVSVCSSNTYVHLRKSRDGQCGSQDIGCVLLIGGYWRSKDTWQYGVRAARRESFIDYGWGR